MRASTVRIPGGGGCALLLPFLGIGFLAALFGNSLRLFVSWDMSRHGLSLGEALWQENTRPMTILTSVALLILVVYVVGVVVTSPSRRTVREVRVDLQGVEFVASPKWWYRGHRARLYWDDIQVISAEHAVVKVRTRKSTRHVRREVLDIYLYRAVDGLPDFAPSAKVTDPQIEGVVQPAWRIRIGESGEKYSTAAQSIAAELGAVRPDLFYQGFAVDQWYTPDSAPQANPIPSAAAAPAPEIPEESTGKPPAAHQGGFALPVDVWLTFRQPTSRIASVLVGLPIVAAVSYIPIHLLSQTAGGILLGLIALVCVVPFAAAVLGYVIYLIALPKTLAHSGIMIDADGVEVVEKPRFSIRGLVRSRIPWSDVQAIVARQSAALDEHGINRYENQAVTDIYLRGDTAFQRPGVGLSIEVTSLQEPASAYVGALASFPAVRLRLPHSQKAEDQTAQEWQAVRADVPSPHTLPGAQLQAALFAARPDLCHGFAASGEAGG